MILGIRMKGVGKLDRKGGKAYIYNGQVGSIHLRNPLKNWKPHFSIVPVEAGAAGTSTTDPYPSIFWGFPLHPSILSSFQIVHTVKHPSVAWKKTWHGKAERYHCTWLILWVTDLHSCVRSGGLMHHTNLLQERLIAWKSYAWPSWLLFPVTRRLVHEGKILFKVSRSILTHNVPCSRGSVSISWINATLLDGKTQNHELLDLRSPHPFRNSDGHWRGVWIQGVWEALLRAMPEGTDKHLSSPSCLRFLSSG